MQRILLKVIREKQQITHKGKTYKGNPIWLSAEF